MPDAKQANSVIYVAFGCSLLSVAGALFIIANWVCNRAARRLFFLRLIVFLALANLLSIDIVGCDIFCACDSQSVPPIGEL